MATKPTKHCLKPQSSTSETVGENFWEFHSRSWAGTVLNRFRRISVSFYIFVESSFQTPRTDQFTTSVENETRWFFLLVIICQLRCTHARYLNTVPWTRFPLTSKSERVRVSPGILLVFPEEKQHVLSERATVAVIYRFRPESWLAILDYFDWISIIYFVTFKLKMFAHTFIDHNGDEAD